MRTRILLAAGALLLLTAALHAEDEPRMKRTPARNQGWFGVSITDVTPKFAREKQLKVKEGAFVDEVVDESPADSAGIKEGDVITEFNGKRIELAEDLTEAVRGTRPWSKVTVKVNRAGESKSIAATVGRNRTRTPLAFSFPHGEAMAFAFSGTTEGMELMNLNRQLAEYFDAPGGQGVLVKDVKKKSNAEKAGLKAGDVILTVAKEAVADAGEVREALRDAEEGDKVAVEVLRKGKKVALSLEVSAPDEMFFGDRDHYRIRVLPELERLQERQKELQWKMKELPEQRRKIERLRIEEKEAEI